MATSYLAAAVKSSGGVVDPRNIVNDTSCDYAVSFSQTGYSIVQNTVETEEKLSGADVLDAAQPYRMSPPQDAREMVTLRGTLRRPEDESIDPRQLEFRPEPPSTSTVVAAIGSYVTVSLSIVYFNWWLFTSSFRYPVFVSWVQQLVGLVAVTAFSTLGRRYPLLSRSRAVIPDWGTCVRVAPLTLSFVGMVGLANICLKYVQISTYQVARSLTILFTMALSWVILGETQRNRTIAACGVMVMGFIIGSLDTSTLSLGGVIAGGCSSLFQAAYNVAIKRSLVHVNNDPNLLLFYNLLLSSFMFIPVIFLAGEGSVFNKLILSPRTHGFFMQWTSLVISGVLATLVNLTSYFCIKVTSPLTFNIVGFTKSVLQTVGGISFLGDRVSAQSLAGITLSLVGSGWYSQIKVSEAMAKATLTDNAAGGEADIESPSPYKDEPADDGNALKMDSSGGGSAYKPFVVPQIPLQQWQSTRNIASF